MPKKNYSKWTKSAAASMLAFSLVATPYAISFGEGGKPKVSQSAANAAVLEAELLANMSVENNSGTTASNRFQLNPNGSQDVDFTISGSSLAQASTIGSGKKYVVLGIPEELRGHVAPNGQASIDTAVTVRLNHLPLVEGLIDALDKLTEKVAAAIAATPGIRINIDEVVHQLNIFKTIGAVGQGTFDANVTLSPDGEYLVAKIDDGLGLVAAQNLTRAVNNINNAVQALEATGDGPITGEAAKVLNTTLRVTLKPAVDVAARVVNSTITAGGAIINQLVDVSVLGDTSVTVPTTITGPVDYLNENPNLDAEFVGSVVKTDALNLSVFNETDGRTTTYYQGNYADFAAEEPTDVNTTGDSTAGYTVTGNATPGDTITVYNADNEPVGTGTADENGKFEISLDNTVGPEEDLTVKASNDYGESDGVPTKTPADLAAPEAPSDVNTTGNSTDGYVVTGKTEPGATVNIYDGDDLITSGTADGDGNFSIDVPGTVGPEKELTVKAENDAGEGDGTTTNTPPDPAVAPEAPSDVNTTGNSTDGYVVTGKTEPGATVNIYDGDDLITSGTADGDGNFSIDVPGTVGPEKELTVKAENDAGEGDGTTTNTPPDPAVAPEAPSDVNTTGNSTDGYVVTGKTEPGATVNIYDGDDLITSGTADGDGNFSIDVPGTVGPEKELTVKAENDAGEGDGTTTNTPPDPAVAPEAPSDVNTTGNSTDGYVVTGKTEPGATVNIYDGDDLITSGTADGDGNFSIDVPGTVGPEKELTVKAENDAGEGDGTTTNTPPDPAVAPEAPSDVNTTGNSTDGYVVTGKTEPGATVNIYDGDDLITSGTADGDGNFSIDVPGTVGPEKELTVKAENGAGEGDGTTTNTPPDPAVAPEAPSDVNTTGNSTDGYVVTGKTEPGATVNIYDGDDLITSGTADGDGNFSIDVPGTVGPEKELTVKAENDAGEGDGTTTNTPPDPAVAPEAPSDVNTTGNSTDGYVVTGKTEPGATVNIYDGDDLITSGTADGDGNFSIDVPGTVGPNKDLTVKAENGAGEGDGTTTSTPEDPAVAPDAPVVAGITGNTTDGYVVTGTAEPGATVNVYDGEDVVGTATAGEDGSFSVDVPGSVGAEKELSVTASFGDLESDAATVTTPADELPPGVPVIGTVTGNPVEGYVVVGETAPNASVTIYDRNNNEVGTATADENGNFEVNVPGSVGPNAPLTVQVSNEGGTNEAPVTTPKLSGAITVNSITEPSTIITGSAPLGTQRVLLNVNGKDLSWVEVNEDGTFQFERKYVPTLGDPSTQKVFGAGDEVTVSFYGKGGESVSAGSTVVQAAAVSVVFNEEGVTVDPTTGTLTSIKGYIEGYAANPVSRVMLSINGRDLEIKDVNPDGTFQFDRKYYNDASGNRQYLKAGDEVKVTIYDAGKRGISSTTTVAGENVTGVTIAGFDKATGVITGTTDKRVEKVQLTINGSKLSLATVDPATGEFSFTRKYYTDLNGNTQKIKAGDIIEVSNYSKITLGDSASYTVPAD